MGIANEKADDDSSAKDVLGGGASTKNKSATNAATVSVATKKKAAKKKALSTKVKKSKKLSPKKNQRIGQLRRSSYVPNHYTHMVRVHHLTE